MWRFLMYCLHAQVLRIVLWLSYPCSSLTVAVLIAAVIACVLWVLLADR